MNPTHRIKWPSTNPALPTGSGNYAIWSSVKDGGPGGSAGQVGGAGVCWFVASIWNSRAGTLNGYFSNDGGSNWHLIKAETFAALSGNNPATTAEFYIEPYEHVKFEWLNGGTTQEVFVPNFCLSTQRDPAIG